MNGSGTTYTHLYTASSAAGDLRRITMTITLHDASDSALNLIAEVPSKNKFYIDNSLHGGANNASALFLATKMTGIASNEIIRKANNLAYNMPSDTDNSIKSDTLDEALKLFSAETTFNDIQETKKRVTLKCLTRQMVVKSGETGKSFVFNNSAEFKKFLPQSGSNAEAARASIKEKINIVQPSGDYTVDFKTSSVYCPLENG